MKDTKDFEPVTINWDEVTSVRGNTMRSMWCIKCYPVYKGAFLVYKGNSLCEKYFKEELTVREEKGVK